MRLTWYGKYLVLRNDLDTFCFYFIGTIRLILIFAGMILVALATKSCE